jgi:hypothetical protein
MHGMNTLQRSAWPDYQLHSDCSHDQLPLAHGVLASSEHNRPATTSVCAIADSDVCGFTCIGQIWPL